MPTIGQSRNPSADRLSADAAAKPDRHNPRHYKYYDLVMAAFVTVLPCPNLTCPGNPSRRAKMKISPLGRWIWPRTIGSTIFSEGLDSVIFYPVAFAGLWSTNELVNIIIFNWIFKVAIETVRAPVAYAVVGWLKRA